MAIDDDTVDELVTAPKKTTGDEGSVEERSIGELLEGTRHRQNAERSTPPMHRAKIQKPGTP